MLAAAFEAEIIATDECEGLSYSKLKQSPYRAATGAQYAEFQLTCKLTGLPAGATVAYRWSPVQTANPTNPPAGAIWVPSPGTASSTVGWAYDGVGLGSTGQGQNGWDNVWLRLDAPYTYAAHTTSPFLDFSHHYYAASRVASGTTGCFVGTYRIKLWTDRVDHIKE